MDTHLSLHREVNQFAPQLDRLEAFGAYKSSAGQLTSALRVLEHDTHAQSVRMLHVAADLHWVAPSGLLMPYWRTLIRHLLGGYTRTVRPPTSELFDLDERYGDGVGADDGEGSKSDDD